MVINQETFGPNGLRMYIQGRIDVNTSPQLREQIAAVDPSVTQLILDFRDVNYISSAGLRELMICRKRFSGPEAMLIDNISPEIYRIFEDVGFLQTIPMHLMEKNLSNYVSLSFKAFLKRKVEESADSVALVSEQGSWTWLDIEKASQIIADDLAKLGVTTRTHVALCGANSVNWVLTFYAIQKLGAIAMLINPQQFAPEMAKAVKNGDITHFCWGEIPALEDEAAFFEELSREGASVTASYSFRKELDYKDRFAEYENVREKYQKDVEADDPCTMIFTSGSTGRSKGVLLSSYNILNAASINCADQTLRGDDRTCLILPLFHIFGLVAGLFANAIAGSAIYLPKDIRTATLLELMTKEQCTVFHTVPTMLIAILNNPDFSTEKMSSLRCTILSAAAATQAQIRLFQEKLPQDHFLSSYGLSEMAPVSITPYGDTNDHILNTVGKPVKNIKIKIADRTSGRECALGESGEILVQGFNLMVGYYKVPVEDQAIDEEGWLHTGDLGYMTEDGYLCLSGRIKELIIRGGENIMPSEVEDAVSALDMVEEVKVIGVPSDFFGEEVGACIRLKAGFQEGEDQINEIRERLKGALAPFKIPAHIVFYETFPVLGSGKIDMVSLKRDALESLIGKKLTKDQ